MSLPRVKARVLSGTVRLERKRLETRASFSLSPVDFTHTSHLASGEIRICCADSAKIISSAFHFSILVGALVSSARATNGKMEKHAATETIATNSEIDRI